MASSSFSGRTGRCRGCCGRCEFRVEFDGLAIGGDGLVQLLLVGQGVAEVVVGVGQLRIEFDGLAVGGDGLVQLLLALQSVAEVVVGIGVLRVEFDGLAVGSDGLVQLLLGVQGVAEVVVGIGELRVEFDGLAVAGDGLVQLPLCRTGRAEVVVGEGVFRVELDGLAVSRRWPRPASPEPSGRRRGCCGLRPISGRVRWPCGRQAMASSNFFLAVRTLPRSTWAVGGFRIEFDGLAVGRRWPRPAFFWACKALPRLL